MSSTPQLFTQDAFVLWQPKYLTKFEELIDAVKAEEVVLPPLLLSPKRRRRFVNLLNEAIEKFWSHPRPTNVAERREHLQRCCLLLGDALTTFTAEHGLPPIAVRAKSDRHGTVWYYEVHRGCIAIPQRAFFGNTQKEQATFLSMLAHEFTHAEQIFLSLRHLADSLEVGARFAKTDVEALRSTSREIFGDPAFARRVVSDALQARRGIVLSDRQRQRASLLLQSLTNSSPLPDSSESIQIRIALFNLAQFLNSCPVGATETADSYLKHIENTALLSPINARLLREHSLQALNVVRKLRAGQDSPLRKVAIASILADLNRLNEEFQLEWTAYQQLHEREAGYAQCAFDFELITNQ